jgi:hypothetical protein
MTRKQDPAARVVTYFETAPIEAARTVLGICSDILQRRRREDALPGVLRDPSPPARIQGTDENS